MTTNLNELLGDLHHKVKTELHDRPSVTERKHAVDITSVPSRAREWHRLTEAVAVVADLKSSTRLTATRKRKASTASVYEAATGNAVNILHRLGGANYIAIQGDGLVGLFWGEGRQARALCSALTIVTFSERLLVPELERKWQNAPSHPTGFKVGVAASSLLVKRVGLPQRKRQKKDLPVWSELVWAGRAVNFAAKCAQHADRHELVVTRGIGEWLAGNEYLSMSCGCDRRRPGDNLWENTLIGHIPADGEHKGRKRSSGWCEKHGADFCDAILRGHRHRPDLASGRNREREHVKRGDPTRSPQGES